MAEYGYFQEYDSEQFSFFRIPKMMITDAAFSSLSLEAVFLYGILLDRTALSRKNGWIDDNGHVYIIYPVEEMMQITGRSKNKILTLLRELSENGLLERKRQGLTKPNIIYVKNFSKRISGLKSELPEVQNKDFRKFTERTSGCPSNELQEVPVLNPSNTNIRETDLNETDVVKERYRFGRFLNVFLTQQELEQFQREYPDCWMKLIGRLSEYMASTGKRYENHYATLCLWAGKEKQEKKIRNYEDTEVMHL